MYFYYLLKLRPQRDLHLRFKRYRLSHTCYSVNIVKIVNYVEYVMYETENELDDMQIFYVCMLF